MFEKNEITVSSIIKGAADNLVRDLRAWNQNIYEADDETNPEKVRESRRDSAAALDKDIRQKTWMLGDMGLRSHIKTNERGYAETLTINGAEFEVITDSFMDNRYR